MCGIAAIIGVPSAGGFAALGAQLVAALKHRGPDAQAVVQLPCKNGRELLLVHCRLSILDLSPAGHQPMRDPESGNIIIFNGEIYNFAEIKAELQKHSPEYAFCSTSDTEVLLRGYATWGTKLLPKLDGMFTFILFDRGRRKLVVARDHVGIKPLYYARQAGGGWAFASEVRALIKADLTERRIDPAAMASFLRFGAVSEPATVCQGVRSFPAGSWAELSVDVGQELAPVPYWRPESFFNRQTNPADHAALLEATLRDQLVADVPVGLFLSAGIDSSALATLAAKLAPGRIKTFTIRSGHGTDDEAEVAAATARCLGLTHVVEALSDAKIEGWVFDGIGAMDQPSSDGTNSYLVSRASREFGMIAVLAGTGADELHGGYPHFSSLPRWSNPLLAVAGKVAGAGLLDLAGRGNAAERLRLFLAAAPSLQEMLAEKRRYFTPSWIALHAPGWREIAGEPGERPVGEPADARDALALGELSGYLLNTLLRDSDWATMANSQELRVPYLGRRYIEYVLGLPWTAKGRKGQGPNKPLIAATIPPSWQGITGRPKTGFELDYPALLLGPHREAFVVATQYLNGAGFALDGARMLVELRGSQSRKDARRLWSLLALGAYLERHRLSR
jgi:asparagine synthase (glutamine-hydrolysing)